LGDVCAPFNLKDWETLTNLG